MNSNDIITIWIDDESITASAGILNVLSMFAREAHKKYKEDGYEYLSEWAKNVHDEIHFQLKKMGLYER